ncbi:MAG: ATP-binding cassette domain-containing protein, partial [Candidatus Margulisiibacteriota bacterium]
MIEIRKLSKRFGEKEVLKNIDLVVEKGERIAIIGGSGCGKSTLLRLILGLQRPDNGRVLVDEKDVHRISYDALRKLRLKFGTLFQSSALFDSMTVAENVGFSLVENLRLPAGQVSDIVKDKLEWVAMSGYENQMPS